MPQAKIFGNFKYQSEGQKKGSVYFKCNNYPLCHGRGVEDPNGFRVTIGHDCQEQPNAQRNKDFHNALKSKMSKHAKPFQVYQEVAKDFPAAAVDFPFPSKKNTMKRVKISGPAPKIESSGIRGLYESINTDEWIERLTYNAGADSGKLQLDLVTDCEGFESLIIWDPSFFNTFNDSSMICIDGTFSRVPLIDDKRKMKNYQLLSVIAVKENVPYTIAWIVMNRKSEIAYNALFQKLFEKFGDYSGNVMSDFETGMRNALRRFLPSATIIGCLFHFCQALQKKAQKLRIWKKIQDDMAGRLILRRFMMLPLLPTAKIPAAFEEIVQSLLDKYSMIFDSHIPKFSFVHYMRETWIESFRLNDISVYRTTHRTNNIIEAYHSKLRNRLVKRPNPWVFLQEITEMMSESSRNLQSMAKGIRVRSTNPRALSQITELNKVWDDLDTGLISSAQFLLNVHNIIQKRVPRMKMTNEMEGSSDESVDDDGSSEEEDLYPTIHNPDVSVLTGPLHDLSQSIDVPSQINSRETLRNDDGSVGSLGLIAHELKKTETLDVGIYDSPTEILKHPINNLQIQNSLDCITNERIDDVAKAQTVIKHVVVPESLAAAPAPITTPRIVSCVPLKKKVLIKSRHESPATITSKYFPSSNPDKISPPHSPPVPPTPLSTLTTWRGSTTLASQKVQKSFTKVPRMGRLQLEIFEKFSHLHNHDDSITNSLQPPLAPESRPAKRMKMIKVPAAKCLKFLKLAHQKAPQA